MNRPTSGKSGYEPRPVSSTSTYLIGGAGLALVVAIIVAIVLVNRGGDPVPVDEQVLADNATATVGTGGPVIDVFEDFGCPACREFEEQSGQAIADAVAAGELTVRYHMLTFMDERSDSGDYSSRAAGAAVCVADASPEMFLPFASALYAATPADTQPDLSNEEIARIAAEQGADPAVADCIVTGAQIETARTEGQASREQLANARGGDVGTPTVLHGDDIVENILDGTGWLDSLIG